MVWLIGAICMILFGAAGVALGLSIWPWWTLRCRVETDSRWYASFAADFRR
jgi:hypothetical protein